MDGVRRRAIKRTFMPLFTGREASLALVSLTSHYGFLFRDPTLVSVFGRCPPVSVGVLGS